MSSSSTSTSSSSSSVNDSATNILSDRRAGESEANNSSDAGKESSSVTVTVHSQSHSQSHNRSQSQSQSRLQWEDSPAAVISVFRRMAPLPEHAPFALQKDDDDSDADADADADEAEAGEEEEEEDDEDEDEEIINLQEEEQEDGVADNAEQNLEGEMVVQDDGDVDVQKSGVGLRNLRGRTAPAAVRKPARSSRGGRSASYLAPRVRVGQDFQASIPSLLSDDEKVVDREKRVLQGRIDGMNHTKLSTLQPHQPSPYHTTSSAATMSSVSVPHYNPGVPLFSSHELIGFFAQTPNLTQFNSECFQYQPRKPFLLAKYKRPRQHQQEEPTKTQRSAQTQSSYTHRRNDNDTPIEDGADDHVLQAEEKKEVEDDEEQQDEEGEEADTVDPECRFAVRPRVESSADTELFSADMSMHEQIEDSRTGYEMDDNSSNAAGEAASSHIAVDNSGGGDAMES